MGALLSSKPIKRLFMRHIGVGRDQRIATTFVFREQKVAYIKIPKAACTSIMTGLLPLTGRQFDAGYDVHKSKAFEVRNFQDCADIFDEDWFIFSVVRHPVDRALSAWRNKCDPKGASFPSRMKLMGIGRDASLDQFVTAIERWPSKFLDPHLMPQSMLLKDANDWPVRVFKLEDLDHAWSIISGEIAARNGQVPAELPIRNVARRADETMAPDIIDRLSKIYDEDFRQFGYSRAM